MDVAVGNGLTCVLSGLDYYFERSDRLVLFLQISLLFQQHLLDGVQFRLV